MERRMKRLLASLTVASLFAVGCSQTAPTSPVARVPSKAVLDCGSNLNNGNNPPNTAGSCGNTGNNSTGNSSNNPPTTASN